ncbi:molybdopterin converting factor subunit 1 [Halobacillus salinarum]|uniref:Molybdopterin synthase sulfur carrier subunit n=1 Tax=Halobacillus salinarum TaxID=2932257 RepID=A0ABY4EG47_9BACI|nr:molybdopterin converting factor subunit 1 [Halobacillus salinarum]UOQ43449.1 molybdopterin converting factor subunit 1 [Halobacillus salinarum]
MSRILLFAGLRETAGVEEVNLEAAGKTIAELRQHMLVRFELPAFKEAMVAINEEFMTEDTIIKEQDVIAFIPPVSGG